MRVYMLASVMEAVTMTRITMGRINFRYLANSFASIPTQGGACSNVIINPFLLGGGPQQGWSLGLRNPWRFSFDGQTGDLYIGDVGESARKRSMLPSPPTQGVRPITAGG
jgi:hypothetical protein